MKRWPKIVIIVFILLFVLSIMTSKTEVVQLDHGSGVGVQIIHDQKLFFIHSFQLKIENSLDQMIYVQDQVSAFQLSPGGTFPLSDEGVILKPVPAGEAIAGQRQTIWRFAKSFHLNADVPFELDGQLQTITISERLGD